MFAFGFNIVEWVEGRQPSKIASGRYGLPQGVKGKKYLVFIQSNLQVCTSGDHRCRAPTLLESIDRTGNEPAALTRELATKQKTGTSNKPETKVKAKFNTCWEANLNLKSYVEV